MPYPAIRSITNFGGVMVDYRPSEDPETDLSADYYNDLSASVAAMTHLAPRAWAVLVGHATTPTVSNSSHDSAWGSLVAVKPTPTRVGTGHFRLTWPTSVTDELGGSYSVNLRAPWCNVRGSTLYFAQCDLVSANVVDLYVFNSSGSANDAAGVSFDIFAQ